MLKEAGNSASRHVTIARYCEKARIMHFANYHYAVARRLSPGSSSIRNEQKRFLGRIARGLYFFGYYDPGVEWVDGQNTLLVSKGGAEKKYFRLIWVERVFVNRGAKPLRLHPDWKARWAAAAKRHREDIEMGRALGFSMGDELVWKGLSVGELKKMCDAVRASFPERHVVIYYNEAWGPIKGFDMQKNKFKYRIPSSLSWFSIDLYRTGTGGDHVAHLRNLYRTRIYPLLHNHQKVALVPGCF
jgi:hypothetical protein